MKQNNTTARWATESIYLASYCISKNCKFIGINRPSNSFKAQFIFENENQKTQQLAEKFFESDGQEARELFHALKDLKSLLHEERKENYD